MIDFGQIRTLRDEAEYEAALAAVRPYFEDEPDPRTPESENFDALVPLIEDYEAKHYPIPDAPPAAHIRRGACPPAGQSPDPGAPPSPRGRRGLIGFGRGRGRPSA